MRLLSAILAVISALMILDAGALIYDSFTGASGHIMVTGFETMVVLLFLYLVVGYLEGQEETG